MFSLDYGLLDELNGRYADSFRPLSGVVLGIGTDIYAAPSGQRRREAWAEFVAPFHAKLRDLSGGLVDRIQAGRGIVLCHLHRERPNLGSFAALPTVAQVMTAFVFVGRDEAKKTSVFYGPFYDESVAEGSRAAVADKFFEYFAKIVFPAELALPENMIVPVLGNIGSTGTIGTVKYFSNMGYMPHERLGTVLLYRYGGNDVNWKKIEEFSRTLESTRQENIEIPAAAIRNIAATIGSDYYVTGIASNTRHAFVLSEVVRLEEDVAVPVSAEWKYHVHPMRYYRDRKIARGVPTPDEVASFVEKYRSPTLVSMVFSPDGFYVVSLPLAFQFYYQAFMKGKQCLSDFTNKLKQRLTEEYRALEDDLADAAAFSDFIYTRELELVLERINSWTVHDVSAGCDDEILFKHFRVLDVRYYRPDSRLSNPIAFTLSFATLSPIVFPEAAGEERGEGNGDDGPWAMASQTTDAETRAIEEEERVRHFLQVMGRVPIPPPRIPVPMEVVEFELPPPAEAPREEEEEEVPTRASDEGASPRSRSSSVGRRSTPVQASREPSPEPSGRRRKSRRRELRQLESREPSPVPVPSLRSSSRIQGSHQPSREATPVPVPSLRSSSRIQGSLQPSRETTPVPVPSLRSSSRIQGSLQPSRETTPAPVPSLRSSSRIQGSRQPSRSVSRSSSRRPSLGPPPALSRSREDVRRDEEENEDADEEEEENEEEEKEENEEEEKEENEEEENDENENADEDDE